MDISKETIEKIVDLAEIKMFQVEGKNYSTKPVHLIQYQESQPTPLIINTLKGVVDFVKANIDTIQIEKSMLVIHNEGNVSLQSELKNPSKKRNVYLDAIMPGVTQQSFFGRFHETDQFIINLMANFQKTDSRDELIKILSSIKTENGIQTSDDGMGQSVTAKVGVAVVDKVNIKNPWNLIPFRTFREVEQPSSNFVVRLGMNGNKPQIALFESDGGAWVLDAINKIAQYLKENLPEMVIIA